MKPSVALVVTTTTADPGDVLAARLRSLLEAGWDARILCKGGSWEGEPALRDPALESRVEFPPVQDGHPAPRSLLRRVTRLMRHPPAGGGTGLLERRMLELRPDLIHFHSGWTAQMGMHLKGTLGCGVVVSLREDCEDLDVPHPKRLWEADLLLFPGRDALERAVARGCPPERAEILLDPLATLGPRLDGRGPEPRPLRVLSVGPLTWERGLEHSVHAIRLLLDFGIACEYRIVGRGDHHLAVAFARHQLDLTQHIELSSPDGGNPLIEGLRRADVFVDPAVADAGSPIPLIKAQALGIPFVATQRDGLPEDAGIAVPRRSAGEIADALATLATDPAIRARMGEAGRTRVDWYPTLEEHLVRLESLYRRALP